MRVIAWFGDVNLNSVEHKLRSRSRFAWHYINVCDFGYFLVIIVSIWHGANMKSKNPHHSESQKLESLSFASKKEVRARAHEMVDQLYNAPKSHQLNNRVPMGLSCITYSHACAFLSRSVSRNDALDTALVISVTLWSLGCNVIVGHI